MLAAVLTALALVQTPPPPAPPGRAPIELEAPAPPKGPRAPAPRAAPPALPAPPAPPAPLAPPAPRLSVLRGEWPDKPSGKKITLDDSYILDDALQEIADQAGWNAVLNTGRTGNKHLTLKLKEVPVEDALRTVLSGSGLVATRTGETIVIADAFQVGRGDTAVLSGFDKPTGKKFTGEFQDTPVPEALRKIAKAAGLSIVLPPSHEGTVSASFVDVPVEEALKAVLKQANLSATREGSLLTVEASHGFPGFPGILPGLGRDATRFAEQKMREAEREVRRAERERERAERGAERADPDGRDRQSTGGDLTVRAGDQVRDVNVVKGQLVIQGGAEARDVSVVAGSAKVESGASVRDLAVVLGTARLEGGAHARQVVAVGGDVEIGPGAEVEQEAISIGGKVRIDPSAEVGSSKSISIPSLPGLVGVGIGHQLGSDHVSPVWRIFHAIVKFAVLFVLGLLVLAVAPRRMEVVGGTMTASPGKSVLAGLLGWVAMPVLTLLLVVTVIGIPLIAVQVLAVIAAGIVGTTAISLYLGRSLPVNLTRSTTVLQLALGTAVFTVLTEIPVIGIFVWIVVSLLALGAVIRSRFGQPPIALPTTPVPPDAPA